jgi:hypothetical protein
MRYTVLAFLLLALVFAVSDAEEPADMEAPEVEVTLEDWLLGQSRSGVVELLGKPSKKKRRDGEEVFLYVWDGSPTQPGVFPGSGPHLTAAPLPIAASPQPSDLGAEAVGGSKAPPLPPNWQELKGSWDPKAEDWETRKSLAALEITFGDDDRVSSCRMVPRKNKKGAKEPKPE